MTYRRANHKTASNVSNVSRVVGQQTLATAATVKLTWMRGFPTASTPAPMILNNSPATAANVEQTSHPSSHLSTVRHRSTILAILTIRATRTNLGSP